MRGRARRAARAVSSAVVSNRDVHVRSRHGWVRFGCSGGGITVGDVHTAVAHLTYSSAWHRISRPVTAWRARIACRLPEECNNLLEVCDAAQKHGKPRRASGR